MICLDHLDGEKRALERCGYLLYSSVRYSVFPSLSLSTCDKQG